MRFRVRDSFPAAHRIRLDDDGTLEPIHVHHWRAEAVVEASTGDTGMARAVRATLRDWVRQHRGRCLNDILPFDVVNPTAEEVARELARTLTRAHPGVHLVEVTIGEAAGFWASYRPALDTEAPNRS